MTLTKEEQIQAIYDLKVGYTLGHADIAILKSMARQLLASMEQEPIAWLNDAYLGRGVVDGEAGSEDAGPGYIPVYREPTYTAPPAPVSVPEEVASAIESLKQTLVDCNRYNYCFDAVKRVEDACRAAMLQGAAGHSPAIPDWQAEAEKMAELHGSSFVVFRNGESPQCADSSKVIISFTDEGLGHGAAAPQQEVE